MNKILIIPLVIVSTFLFSQKTLNNELIKDKYEKTQPQDMSLPPPPVIAFPAQFPRGNNFFLDEI